MFGNDWNQDQWGQNEAEPVMEAEPVAEPVDEPVMEGEPVDGPMVEAEPVEDEPVAETVDEPVDAKPKTKPKTKTKPKAKTKTGVSPTLVRDVLDAHARLDRVREPLRALTGKDDDADLTAALLDGRATPAAQLLVKLADEPGEAARAILLVKTGQKDPNLLRDTARLATAVNPDLTGRLNTTNMMDLSLVLSETVTLLDRTVLEALAE